VVASGNTYGYDSDERKVVQTTGNSPNVYYLWSSVLGQPVVEMTAAGGVYRAYVYNPGGQMLGGRVTTGCFIGRIKTTWAAGIS
jgi:hypothetical protein